jgi:hypothetical protein
MFLRPFDHFDIKKLLTIYPVFNQYLINDVFFILIKILIRLDREQESIYKIRGWLVKFGSTCCTGTCCTGTFNFSKDTKLSLLKNIEIHCTGIIEYVKEMEISIRNHYEHMYYFDKKGQVHLIMHCVIIDIKNISFSVEVRKRGNGCSDYCVYPFKEFQVTM